ncbi:MAG: transporter, family, oxalate/formate antiporter, partial [Gaiellales bacterium]|nr:transporter, family, oxalate/formate antiporter [Gaiellales bacterium]
TNYGMLYTAKGTASLLVPLGNVLTVSTGSWNAVFIIAAVLNIVAAVMALVVLKPMRIRAMAKGCGVPGAPPVAARHLGGSGRGGAQTALPGPCFEAFAPNALLPQ